MDTERMKRVNLRPIDIDRDVHLIVAWLADEDVHRWYREGEHTVENYRQRFAPEPTNHKFIVEIDGEPTGYIQAYRLSDEPDYARQLGLEIDAVSLDMMIGNPAFRGSGWGTIVLQATLDRIVFGHMASPYACINPDPENIRAVKSYERAGFHGDRVVWIQDDDPDNTGYERVMTISREDFYGSDS